MEIKAKVLKQYKPLYEQNNYSYFVFYGGRGGSKSFGVAQYLIFAGLKSKLRILCTREIQRSISSSVLKLLSDLIVFYKLDNYYKITQNSIIGINGTEFLFEGLYSNIAKIKSMQGADLCWIEEADTVSRYSFEVLDPTLRKNNSRIIITFNPNKKTDVVYDEFIVNKKNKALVVKINHSDNPFFPAILKEKMEAMKATDYERYLHIYEGQLRTVSDQQVFKNKFEVKSFDETKFGNPIFGLDFGFSNDPLACVELYTNDNYLYVRRESYKLKLELNHTAKYLINDMPKIEFSRIPADSASPQNISYLKQHGLAGIEPVRKWAGSIQDGINIIRSYNKVIIHPDCKNTAMEFLNYSFKIDPKTGEILPIMIDRDNHAIDAIRYALVDIEKYIDYGSLL